MGGRSRNSSFILKRHILALAQDTESVTVVCRVDFRKPSPCEWTRIVEMLLNNNHENAASCQVHYLSVAHASGS